MVTRTLGELCLEVPFKVSVFLRTVIVFLAVAALAGGASAASADRFAQATATPTAAAAAATATAVPCTTARSGIQIILENPSPGDTIQTGNAMVINGVAYDPAADTGAGISSVTVYLGDRTAGGTALGIGILGQPNPLAAPGSQFATAGFTLRTPPLPSGSGARTIFVYARSLVSNTEAVLQVPVFLNSAPTPVRGQAPTAVLPTPPPCTPTPVPAATSAPTSPPAVAAPPTATPTTVLAPTPTPFNVMQPLPPAAPPQPPVVSKPAITAAPVTVAPASAQTAPGGGGIPTEVGLLLLGAGVIIVGGGLALRRRERRSS